MEVLVVGGCVLVVIFLIIFCITLAIKYGTQKNRGDVLTGKLNSTKNLAYVVGKELEKYDKNNRTLSFKISRAYSADDFNAIVHEIYEGMSPTDAPTPGVSSISGGPQDEKTTRDFLPTKPRGK